MERTARGASGGTLVRVRAEFPLPSRCC
jgi:hypothetical protein